MKRKEKDELKASIAMWEHELEEIEQADEYDHVRSSILQIKIQNAKDKYKPCEMPCSVRRVERRQ